MEELFNTISDNEHLTTEQIGALAIKATGQIEGLEDVMVFEPEFTGEESE